jgi:threonine dehydrogenase-like Zn-dependent dehydrogenase
LPARPCKKKARVIAIDLDDQKLALAKKAGAAEVINSKTENLHERLQQLTNGEGPASSSKPWARRKHLWRR